MIDIQFEIGGKKVNADNLADAFEAVMLEAVANQLRDSLASVRDPETGEFPTVVVRGQSLETLSIQVEGSDTVVAMATERLSDDFDMVESNTTRADGDEPPHVFLCHASEDKPLVERLATDLRENGIEVFFDKWCIEPGDSIRQRIDEGIEACTHFVVLLTPASLSKPWVNAEMDAGFVKKLDGRCRFVPLRHQLDANQLPPLLSGMNSPAITNYDDDLRALIGFFFGITQKPPLGSPPSVAAPLSNELGVSAAAKRLIDLMMADSRHALYMDPQFSHDELLAKAELTEDEIVDAVYELEGRGLVRQHKNSGSGSMGFARLVPEATLFTAFDKYYQDWDPADDAMRVAAELMNGKEEGFRPWVLAEAWEWSPRRMNPALTYLIERQLVRHTEGISIGPWVAASVSRTPATRRFLASRS